MGHIEEKDRSVLESLTDIRIKYHEKSHGYDLTFHFAPNEYFENETLTKSFQMSKPNIIEKAEGCEIQWKENMNITVKKVKNKKKKGKATGTKTVDAKTFFSFFKTQEMPDFRKIMESGQNPDNLDEEDMRELGSKMDEDFDLGNEIKEQLIPLVLEYYLNVIDFDESDDEDPEGSDDGGDSDDSDAPKPKKGGNKRKGSGASGGSGGAKGGKKDGKKEDCKQQ
jgi:nucleosome assembly protein 1-like 1